MSTCSTYSSCSTCSSPIVHPRKWWWKKTEISVVCQAKIATVWNQHKYCIYVLLFGNIRRNFQSASNNIKILIRSERQFCGYQPLNHHHLDSAFEGVVFHGFPVVFNGFVFPCCLFALFLVIMTLVPMSYVIYVWSKPLYEIARVMALHKTVYVWFFCWLDPQFYSETMVLHDSAQSMGSGGGASEIPIL